MIQAPTILKTGTTTTTTGTSQAIAIVAPGSAGNLGPIRMVRVVCDTVCYIKFGASTVVATANDIMVTSMVDYLDVGGCTHYACIQGTASAKINVTTVEQ